MRRARRPARLSLALAVAAALPAGGITKRTWAAQPPAPASASPSDVDRAISASQAGRHDEAREIIDAAIEHSPDDPVLYLRRSGIAEARGVAELRIAQKERTPASWRAVAASFDDAADAATRWLELAPADAANRPRVQSRVDSLRKRAVQAKTIADTLARPAPTPTPAPAVEPAVEGNDTSRALESIDAARDRREHNAQRRAAGGVVLGFGIAAAGVGIGLVATSLRLHYPSACSDGDPLTPCEDVGVRARRARVGGGAATGVTAAVMMGIGAALLVRTPPGAADEVPRAHTIGARAGGGFTIAVGLGLLATAGAIGGLSARDYDAADVVDETDMRRAVARANAALGLAVAGVGIAAMGAGLLSVPSARRKALSLRAGPVLASSFVGAVLSGRIPW